MAEIVSFRSSAGSTRRAIDHRGTKMQWGLVLGTSTELWLAWFDGPAEMLAAAQWLTDSESDEPPAALRDESGAPMACFGRLAEALDSLGARHGRAVDVLWWGPFDDLVLSDAQPVRELRAMYHASREEWVPGRRRERRVKDRPPVEDEMDDFVEFFLKGA